VSDAHLFVHVLTAARACARCALSSQEYLPGHLGSLLTPAPALALPPMPWLDICSRSACALLALLACLCHPLTHPRRRLGKHMCAHTQHAQLAMAHTRTGYYTNSPTGFANGFDPARPTVLLLHPFALDSSWLRFQTDDPRLSGAFNLLALDQRCAGQTKHRPSGYHDAWVIAADIAFLHHVRIRPPPARLRRALTHILYTDATSTPRAHFCHGAVRGDAVRGVVRASRS
jgi:hypothetical protein